MISREYPSLGAFYKWKACEAGPDTGGFAGFLTALSQEKFSEKKTLDLEHLAPQVKEYVNSGKKILDQIKLEISLRNMVPQSFVHFLLRPYLKEKDKPDKHTYRDIFKNSKREEGGYTSFFLKGKKKYISGEVGYADKVKSELLPLEKLKRNLLQFCQKEHTKDLVILFYGVSGSGKTFSTEKCLTYLDRRGVKCKSCTFFRRPKLFEKKLVEKMKSSLKIANTDELKRNLESQDNMRSETIEVQTNLTIAEFLGQIKQKRKILPTPLNQESSREHTLFTFQKEGHNCYVFDLAGNEKYELEHLLNFAATNEAVSTTELKKKYETNKLQESFEDWFNRQKTSTIKKLYPKANDKGATFLGSLYAYDVTADAQYINQSLEKIKEIWTKAEERAQSKVGHETTETKSKPTKKKSKSKKKKESGKSVATTTQKDNPTKNQGESKGIEATLTEILQKASIDKHLVITLPQNELLFAAAAEGIRQSINFGIELSTIP